MSPTERFNKALALLNTYIDENNLRHTPEREIVLQILAEHDQPMFTVHDVLDRVLQAKISRPTLNNCLKVFVSARILYRLDDASGMPQVLYRWTMGTVSTMRMVCVRCGKQQNFTDKSIIQTVARRKYSNFVPSQFVMYVFGTCKTCRRLKAIDNQKAKATQQAQ